MSKFGLPFNLKSHFHQCRLYHRQTIRLATSRPLGERSEPLLAAKRPTASEEGLFWKSRGPSELFLWDDPDQDQWSEISRIMTDQMNRWIQSGQGFIGSFELPWSEWSPITDPDPDHPKGKHPICLLYTGYLLMPKWKAVQSYGLVWTTTAQNSNKSFKNIKHCTIV